MHRDKIQDRSPDPLVRDRLSAGAESAAGGTMAGLWGDSDRTGFRRLYLTTRLDYFVEFAVEQVLSVEPVPPDEPPFVGLDATRVTFARDTGLDWVRRSVVGSDPFLLEARNATVQPQFPTELDAQCLTRTLDARCPTFTQPFGHSDFDLCQPGEFGTTGPWPTQGERTCQTCNANTCFTCHQGTCLTCGANTCVTCEGVQGCESVAGTCWTCGRATCQNGCTQETCGTCASCQSCAWTCEGTCVSCRGTCDATCVSCDGTCDAACEATCQQTCWGTCDTCAGTCQATCDTCYTCYFTCGTCQTDPGWCPIRG